MTEFKVGDRVRCHKNPWWNGSLKGSLKGAIGTVTDTWPDFVTVHFTENNENIASGKIQGGDLRGYSKYMSIPIEEINFRFDNPPEEFLEIITPINQKDIERTIQSLRQTHRLVAEKGTHG